CWRSCVCWLASQGASPPTSSTSGGTQNARESEQKGQKPAEVLLASNPERERSTKSAGGQGLHRRTVDESAGWGCRDRSQSRRTNRLLSIGFETGKVT